MSNTDRLALWIEQMSEAAGNACSYIDGLDFTAFENDKRTPQAVVLNLLFIGELASRVCAMALVFVAAQLPGLLASAREIAAE